MNRLLFVRLVVVGSLLIGSSVAGAAAQQPDATKYWIFLKDKRSALGKLADVEPDHVTARAIDRRERRGNGLATLDRDRPVSQYYINRLAERDVHVQVTSRWLNAVSAYLTADQVADVAAQPFVRGLKPVGVAVAHEDVATPLPLIYSYPSHSRRGSSYELNYGLSETQLRVVNAIDPIEQGYNGSGVRLGFLDTEYGDFTHPAFATLVSEGRLIEVRDFTGTTQNNRHGRMVASVAVGFEQGQLIGPAHGAEVLAATTEYAPTETNQEEDNFVAGLEWLESMGVDVVNVSLGYTTFDSGQNSYTPDDLDGDTGITTVASDIAASLGVVMVTSAGNWVSPGCTSPAECWYYISTPADGDSVIAVGAVTSDSSRASFSSFGPTADGRIKPDVSAMGVAVYLAATANGYGGGSGTSFSGPMAAGVVCQILQANPALKPMEVLDILRQTSSQSASPDNSLGWGIINAQAAINLALFLVATDHPDRPSQVDLAVEAYPNPFESELYFNVSVAQPAYGSLRIYDVTGRVISQPFSAMMTPGLNRITWSNTGLASGVYFYVLEADNVRRSGRIVRL